MKTNQIQSKTLNPANAQKSICFLLCVATAAVFFAACNDLGINSAVGQTDAIGKSQPENKDGKLTLHRKSVVDSGMRNMKSHTIFVPEGWEMTGETKWAHQAFFLMLPSPKIVVSSPDGFEAAINRTGLFSDPRPSAEYRNMYGIRRPRENTSDGGYPVMYRPDSLREWKKYFKDAVIPQRHPTATNIRVKSVTKVKEFTDAILKRSTATINSVNQSNRIARAYGLPESQEFEAQGLVIEATFNENGIEKEFVALAGLTSLETQMQGMLQVNWSVEPNLSYTGPKGKLEKKLPMLFAITGSMRPTTAWTGKIQEHLNAMSRRGKRPSNSSVNVGNTFSDILDISHNGYQKRNAIKSGSQGKYVNSIHETSSYSSGGNSYSLPAGYDHVYTDDFDTIVLTNDSLFDPNVEIKSTQGWTKMSAK